MKISEMITVLRIIASTERLPEIHRDSLNEIAEELAIIEKNTDKRVSRKVKSENAKHPTVEEVRQYCLEKGYNIDPEEFVSFYESRGWMIGKYKMVNWKSAVATWNRNEIKRQKEKLANREFWENKRKKERQERVNDRFAELDRLIEGDDSY